MVDTPHQPGQPAQWDTMGKGVMGAPADTELIEERMLVDGIEVKPQSAPVALPDTLPHYNPSHTFEIDLIHEKIEISFDWAKKRALGKATLTLRPWFYATDKVTLDAKNFDIQSVVMEGQTEQLKYDYDNAKLLVNLGRSYARTQDIKLVITYVAKPDEREKVGGSAAITSDKGLYFINADGSDADKPRQIWTQGETESNSFWMPTVDKPNERCTQEMYITVADKYKTLSNGLLISSKKNADGTRTDYWKMDKPHAPYLFMMAIGEYAVVKEKWRDINLEYYVEPKYEQYAKDIFPYTAELLEFYSTRLGYNYPWSKFSQIVVRDYVSGAMENTTAVIFGEFMQHDKRELLDNHLTNESIVAHEMFHHWFGDLVTCESWSNLTLNEGFANYSEYLWMEHKYGRDVADEYALDQRDGYFYNAQQNKHPLINFGYNERESMFDGHSYNKGGAILHMLRTYLGDDAFFAGLQRYLKKNEFTDVEAHELRLAFEDVSGQDLNWFFNQWFFGNGHPTLEMTYDWDAATKKASVTIEQKQKAEKGEAPVFDVPMAVDLYDASGKARRETIRLTHRTQTFTFDAPTKPALINVDAEKVLLCEKTDNHTTAEWIFMYNNAPLYMDHWEALEGLSKEEGTVKNPILSAALKDKNKSIRQRSLQGINAKTGRIKNTDDRPTVAKIAGFDPEPSVRAAALRVLGDYGDKQYQPIVEQGLGDDQAYSVVGAALGALYKLDQPAAVLAAAKYEKADNENLIGVLAKVYGSNPDATHLNFFNKNVDKADQNDAFVFFEQHRIFLVGLKDPALLDIGINQWKGVAMDEKNSEWRRFSATKALSDTRAYFRDKGETAKVDQLNSIITDIKACEKNETLKLYYDMF